MPSLITILIKKEFRTPSTDKQEHQRLSASYIPDILLFRTICIMTSTGGQHEFNQFPSKLIKLQLYHNYHFNKRWKLEFSHDPCFCCLFGSPSPSPISTTHPSLFRVQDLSDIFEHIQLVQQTELLLRHRFLQSSVEWTHPQL